MKCETGKRFDVDSFLSIMIPEKRPFADLVRESGIGRFTICEIHEKIMKDEHSSSAVQSPLGIYLREIGETPLLTAREEQQLAVAIEHGDRDARDKMVLANLRLVVRIARGYTGRGLDLPDLIGEGNLGLLHAIKRFDPGMGTRFATYAVYWIRQSIRRALFDQGKPIRIPAYMIELLYRWHHASGRLSETLGRQPTPEEIANDLCVPHQRLPYIRSAIHINNLTPHPDHTEAGWSLGEMLVDGRFPRPDEELLRGDNLSFVMSQLDLMDPRESAILRMRFGLGSCKPHSVQEISDLFGLSRERVRQIETEILNRLADSLEGAPPEQPV